MTLIPWGQGRYLAFDYTCSDTFAASYITQTSQEFGRAARLWEERKKRKYAHLLNRFIFIPVAMETTGVWGEEGLHLMKAIGHRLADATGEMRATSFLLQRMSIAVQRGNATSVLGTLPAGKELEEVFKLLKPVPKC